MVFNSHYTCPLFPPTLWERVPLCWSRPKFPKASMGCFCLPPLGPALTRTVFGTEAELKFLRRSWILLKKRESA